VGLAGVGQGIGKKEKGHMARQKKRPENTPYVYAYDILTEKMPEIVFTTAKNQQTLWNWLAVEHQTMVESLAEASKDQKKEAYKQFEQRAKAYVRDQGTALQIPCWAKWQIWDNFTRSQQAWAGRRAGAPSVKHGLRRIQIENRTDTKKGAPVSWIFRDSNLKPFHLRRQNGLVRGYFKINTERVHFETVMHRPLEEDCILKRYSLCGTYEPAFRNWQWKIVMLMERPPREVMHGNTIAAMDLGWRRREDGLRLGVIYTERKAHGVVFTV
jgi:hypothetical protein